MLGRSYQGAAQRASVYGGNYLAVSKRPLNRNEIQFAEVELELAAQLDWPSAALVRRTVWVRLPPLALLDPVQLEGRASR